ncbi:hypothetical protein NDU88_005293 [Pleurodeles waltl]|uniref:Peptidase A2 domain-containing protein n=1 Tax=Pleurodeles waltl TaxID=8319 RepID=A0AAV7MX23_PLEWA|nr:hypothetical protein NDU88_005293 [Pleurodeles waltl]
MSQNNTVQQFPLRGEDGINDEWSDDSSDSEECRLAASLEVDQKGPYAEGKVMGHKVSFLVDTGATSSTVRSAEVPKLPLSGRTIRVVGVANQYLTNLITDPVQVEIGNFQGQHKLVVCDSSTVSLLVRDLLCKTKCLITCSNEGIEVQTNSDDEGDDGQFAELETEIVNEEYPLTTLFPMLTVTDLPAELQGTVTEKVWDLTGKEVGLIKGVEPVKVQVKPNAVFPQVLQYHMAQDVLIQVSQIIADFVKQGVLKEVLSSLSYLLKLLWCNAMLMSSHKTLGVILTPVGGGSRPPGGNRQKTVPRSNDRSGHSDFPAGPAGDRQKAARRPSGKAPSTMKPAPNGAGGVEGVRRVQWHPSRFSVSALQTLKIFMGPC